MWTVLCSIYLIRIELVKYLLYDLPQGYCGLETISTGEHLRMEKALFSRQQPCDGSGQEKSLSFNRIILDMQSELSWQTLHRDAEELA